MLKKLQKFGLSVNEAKAYMVLFKKDMLTAQDVAKASKIPPTKVYQVLERMCAKQIIENSDNQNITDSANIIHRSAKKLNKLVDQLLDLSKLEAREMKLKTSQTNIIDLVREIIASFSPLAERKKITIKFTSSDNNILVYLDRDKFEKVLTNILSNAFKFTAENGHITVDVSQRDGNAEIKISDTGIGIPKGRLPKIFNRFYQVDGSHTREQEGTGIGLALTKELLDLHKGEIEVESEEGGGTTFTVRFLFRFFNQMLK